MATKTNIENTEEEKSIDGNKKYWVKNLCGWLVGCKRVTTNGDISIGGNSKMAITDEELRSQVYNNNVLFVGENGDGSHARLYVEDKNFRVSVGFETKTTKQKIVDETVLSEIYKIANIENFKETVKDKIVTDGEKAILVQYAKDNKINDYDKISFVQEYTGYKY